jgi:hypothetical protein
VRTEQYAKKHLLTFSRESYRSFAQISAVMITSLMAVGIVSLVWFALAIMRFVRRRRRPQLGVVSEEWLTLHRADRW